MPLVVLNSPEEWRAHFGPELPRTIVSIGSFDGVHVGHQKILRAVVARARQSAALAAVLTFDPHPLRVVRPQDSPPLLMTTPQRLAAFQELGLDAALVLRFDRALSTLTPEEFAQRVLVETLAVRGVLVGANFRFGRGQAGDVRRLEEIGRNWGFEVHTIAPVSAGGAVVSSTAIRSAVSAGDVAKAEKLLGRPFALQGEIQTGTGQGRHLIVPTLNLATQNELLPKPGVYVTQARCTGKTYRSATNVGMRPTFNGQRITVESHLFDFSEELKSGPLEVLFRRRLRDEQKFSGPEELKLQVLKDLKRARDFFSKPRRAASSRKKESPEKKPVEKKKSPRSMPHKRTRKTL
jgi:riboflavin kinase/FMN adenylyltransferase